MTELLSLSRRVLAAAACGALVWSAPLAAQQPAAADSTRPKTTRETVFQRLRALDRAEVRDTTTKDSLARPVERTGAVTATTPRVANGQTATAAASADFSPDSVMQQLLKLPDMAATQYRGASAVFKADSNNLVLFGKGEQKAGVVRAGDSMVADSLLTFDQTTAIACGFGKPVLSGSASESPVESKEVCYDTRNRIGVAKGARTQVAEGANWFVNGDLYYKNGNLYGHHGAFTDCSLPYPHYHFAASDVKVVNNSVMVARNVTLNFGDVPVFWLPFMMQSLKQGRRTGILMPQFSINDIVRRNSSYNRRISNVGFYWAISDYLGSRIALDWFANNYTALEGSFDYNLNDKFMQGGATVKRFWRPDGGSEFTLLANHTWQPDERTNVAVDAEYATSASFIRQRSYDPRELRRQIRSNGGLSRRFNWGNVSFQASRNQDLSSDRVDLTLPSVGVNFATVTLFPAAGTTASWYNNGTWTASTQVRRTATQFSNSSFDPSSLTGNLSSSFSMGNVSWSQSFDSNENRGPIPVAGGSAGDSVLSSTQRMSWRTSLNFQQRLIGTTTFTPSISLAQDMERREVLANNKLVKAPARIDMNAALKMDLFAFLPGIGPLSRMRHRISPNISYSYSPAAAINPADSLRATVFGASRTRERNVISVGLSQTIEGKYKEDTKRDTTAADSAAIDSTSVDPTRPRRLPQARKVVVLSVNTDVIAYDFAAKHDTTGINPWTTSVSNSINSDMLRGLQLTLTHDLFDEIPADTALGLRARHDFSPHLRRVSASFSLSNNSWLFKFLGLGRKVDAPPATGSKETPVPSEAEGGVPPTGTTRSDYSMMGNRSGEAAAPPRGPTGAWNASFNLTLERPRKGESFSSFGGGNQMMQTNVSFQPTQEWNVTWSTAYSFTDHNFTDHILRFTRQMHDWDANFDFIKAQNGNFSFQFNVRLRANPDIKFDYSQRSNVSNRRSQF